MFCLRFFLHSRQLHPTFLPTLAAPSHFPIQASSSSVFRCHFPYRDSDEDYLVLIAPCAPIDIGAFVDDDRPAVKDGQLLIDDSTDSSRRFR